MRFQQVIASLALIAGTAVAGSAVVQNNCNEEVWLTITRADQSSTQQKLAGNGGRYSEQISGQGNSFGLTKNADYYSASTPKLIWGFSDSNPTLYYSVSSVNGDPFAGEKFQLSATDGNCAQVNSYTSFTYTCADSNTFTLATC
ncbi:hypothetical protein AAFC00_000564 [Neodothiora populina]|uniref:Uncharacterized protein n=1 Tax=Neodothiora populina TaxID=2781224 RepID=A0ABR3PDA1_9PEZI